MYSVFLMHLLQLNREIFTSTRLCLTSSPQYLSQTPLSLLLAGIYPSLTDLHRFSTLQRIQTPPPLSLPHHHHQSAQPLLPHWPSTLTPTPKTPPSRPGLCLRPLRITWVNPSSLQHAHPQLKPGGFFFSLPSSNTIDSSNPPIRTPEPPRPLSSHTLICSSAWSRSQFT